MTPPPVALSLILCEQVIVDHQTRNPTPVSIFTGLAVEKFPSDPQRFSVFTSLTNGRGDGTIKLAANRLDTGESVYEQQHRIHFPDPLLVVNVNIRVRAIRFPAAGRYEFVLFVDSDPVAQRTSRVYAT
jgi:hypothetical protein